VFILIIELLVVLVFVVAGLDAPSSAVITILMMCVLLYLTIV
jgi:hypothetical protein